MFACHRIAVLAALLATPSLLWAEYEYRYVEGEAFARSELAGLRDEGFTSWMAHPSHGKIAVFGCPAGGYLEYDIKALGRGPYTLFVRCLALSDLTKTRVLWDGKDLGLIQHDKQGTALKWSSALGPLAGAGDHRLRLEGSADSIQWPYIDTVLLTNQPGYTPDDADADFESYTTPWPTLSLPQADGKTRAVAPGPPTRGSSGPAALEVSRIVLDSPGIGATPLSVSIRNTGQGPAKACVTASLAAPSAPAGVQAETVDLAPAEARDVRLLLPVHEAGALRLRIAIGAPGLAPADASYPVTVPSPVIASLDEYAYPLTAGVAKWTARFTARPDALAKMAATVELRAEGAAKPLTSVRVAAGPAVDVPIDISHLGIGRYEVCSRFTFDGKPMLIDRREFIKHPLAAGPVWEPVQETRAVGDTVTMNGKPFLPLFLGHAGIDQNTASHRYTMVACFGGDPDPRASIRSHLDLCQKSGLYGTVALFNNAYFVHDGAMDLARLEEVVLANRDHPALFGWDLFDEPDGNGVAPEKVRAAADLIRRLDPKHIIWVNLCQPDKALSYLDCCDIWSFDYYPLPTLKPFSYHVWLDISDAKLRGRRPLGSWLQTFVEDATKRRMPTPDELRDIAYLHIIHGYKWLAYYSYYDGEPAGCLARDPVLWSYTRALNSELLSLAPVILAPGEWKPVRFEPATVPIEVAEKRVGDKSTVIVVSNSPTPLTVRLHPTATGRCRLLFESNAGPKAAGGIMCSLRPFGSHVYELTK